MTTTPSSSRSPPLLAPRAGLLLDFDGTLVDLAPHPDAVVPSPHLTDWLQELAHLLDRAVAVVSGRRLQEIDEYLAPLRLIGAGAHGAELRLDVTAAATPTVPRLESALLADIMAAIADLPGVWLENKAYVLAVHYRQNPAAEAACHARVREALAAHHGVEMFGGHAVVEVRRTGIGKGPAITRLLGEPAFKGRTPLFIGDDEADEGGFAVVQAAGGHGVRVGSSQAPTCAHFRLADVDSVHRWLRQSLVSLKAHA